MSQVSPDHQHKLPSSPESPYTGSRLDFLDGLRGLACLLVLIHHAYIQVWNIFKGEKPPYSLRFLTGWMLYGHFAVSAFIVISGFCLMIPILRNGGELKGGVLLFLRKRARRILPPYYFALLLSLILPIFAPRIYSSVRLTDILTHLFLIHNLFRGHIGSINGVFWSIAVESQIYLLFPALVWLWRTLGGILAVLLTTVVAYFISYLILPTSLAGLTPHYIALFALGTLACTIAYSSENLWQSLREKIPWSVMLAGLSSLILAWCYGMGWERVLGEFQTMTDLGVGIWAMALLVVASSDVENLSRNLLSWKPIVTLGRFAYSIYLIHLPLLLIAWKYGVQPLKLAPTAAFAMLLSFCPVIIGASWLFYMLCEKPFIRHVSK